VSQTEQIGSSITLKTFVREQFGSNFRRDTKCLHWGFSGCPQFPPDKYPN